jgi:protein-tyrosine phosphatase
MKILMVCLGNICRSPIAEGVLKNLVSMNNFFWKIESAGMENYHTGEPPHRYSQKICQKNGIDISQQRARQFVDADFENFDKIYAMSQDVLEMLKNKAGSKFDSSKVMLFLNEFSPGKNQSVPDPWYGPEEDYEIVFELINKTCQKIVAKYNSEHF